MDAKQKLLAGAAILATSLAAMPDAMAQTYSPTPNAAVEYGADTMSPGNAPDTLFSANDHDALAAPGPDTLAPIDPMDTLFGAADHDPLILPPGDTIHSGADTLSSAADTVFGGGDHDLLIDEYMGTLSGELLVEQNRLPAIQVPPPVEIPRTVVPTVPAGETPSQPAAPGAQGKP